MASPAPSLRKERFIVFLVGAVQFVNVLDFMMVMPMGPDFAAALGIPLSHLGYVGGSYTAAASVSGLVGSFFLDRFDRRKALAVSMLGLVIATASGGFAQGFAGLIVARVLAGLFGGPATSLAGAIIVDVVPEERRGRALGAVMGAFALASVLGVPVGLELARRGGWRLPFFAVAGLGLVVAGVSVFLLPPLKGHLDSNRAQVRLRDLFSRQVVHISLVTTAVLMMSSFLLVPNISAYLQHNLGYPRESLGTLYLVGGSISFFTVRLAGGLVDRFGAPPVGAVGSAFVILDLFLGFFMETPVVPTMLIFVGFMVSTSFRAIPYNALASKVPRAAERARYMSIQSAVQHMSAALGGFISSSILTELPDGRLQGVKLISIMTIALHVVLPALYFALDRMLREERRAPLS